MAVVLIYDINYPDGCSGNILFYRAQVSSAHKDDTKLLIIDETEDPFLFAIQSRVTVEGGEVNTCNHL